jgi:hypothetical protein
MKIIFAAHGLGKSHLLKQNSNYIDCDTVIEAVMGAAVTNIVKDKELWDYCKSNILVWWKEYFHNKNLLVGKDRYIKDAQIVYLHISVDEMGKRIASSSRENPIFDWDCQEKDSSYFEEAIKYNIPVKRILYLSDHLV